MNVMVDYNTVNNFLQTQPYFEYAGEIYGLDSNDITIVKEKIRYVWKWESLNAMRLRKEQKTEFAKHIISLNVRVQFPPKKADLRADMITRQHK